MAAPKPREPKLLHTIEKPIPLQVYEAVTPIKAEIKDLNAEVTDHKKRLKEAGHEAVNFAYCEKAAKLEPVVAAARKRDLDQMWRDFNLPDPVSDDLLERNLHAVTSGSNGEIQDEPDVDAVIPLPSPTPPAAAYRDRREPNMQAIADKLESETKAFVDKKAAKANAFRDRMAAARDRKRSGAPN